MRNLADRLAVIVMIGTSIWLVIFLFMVGALHAHEHLERFERILP